MSCGQSDMIRLDQLGQPIRFLDEINWTGGGDLISNPSITDMQVSIRLIFVKEKQQNTYLC